MKLYVLREKIMKNPNSILEIQGKKIGRDFPTYFIADIAANHDGDLERAKDLIYLAAEAGADAAKFQHFKAETIVSDRGFKTLGGQQSHQSEWEKSVFEVYKDASVNLDWTETLKETCDKAGIPFFTTPYALDVVDYMDAFVPAYKIGSGDITWAEMIEKVAHKQKPYIIATGASTLDEVHRAVNTALSINPMLGLMQCNTNYTASLENFVYIQLNVLKTYRDMYPDLVLGLSDHTPGHATVLGAVTLGARMIEKHFTDDIHRAGPDHAFSMDPKSWRDMVDRTRELEAALGTGIKVVEENEMETVVLQRRALRATKNFSKEHVVTSGDFVALRPCPQDALQPFEVYNIIGKVLKRSIIEGDYLKNCDMK
jgi:sialic acid synthase SpsE